VDFTSGRAGKFKISGAKIGGGRKPSFVHGVHA
jgi:hypothetical protein